MTASARYPGACEICSGYWATYDPAAQAVVIGESIPDPPEIPNAG